MLGLYLIPFGIAFMIPGWRSLAAYGVAIVALAAWGIYSAHHTDGPGGALGAAYLFISGCGLIAGWCSRAVTLALGGRRRPLAFAAVVLLGFFSLPALLEAQGFYRDWSRRLPGGECYSTTPRVELAGKTLYVPLMPILAVDTGGGGPAAYYLFDPAAGRRLCSDSGSVSATAIHFYFNNLRREAPSPLFKAFCTAESARRKWAAELCGPAADPDELGYPVKASVYDAARYDHRKMLASSRGARETFAADATRAEAAGRPLTFEKAGRFLRYSDGFFVPDREAEAEWRSQAGAPIVFFCLPPHPDLYCSTTYLLDAGRQVTYDFRARPDDFEAGARRAERKLMALVADMAAAR